MEIDPGAILNSLGPAQRFADPASPKEGRMMAARGALPLPPAQIASVLFALSFDPDAEVKERALQSLRELPDRVADPALEAEIHPGLLAFFAADYRESPERMEKLALNAATSDETYCFLATLPHPRVLEITAHNQTRLLRCPDLVEAISENPLTGQATIGRILEFLGLEMDSPIPSDALEVPQAPEPLMDTAAPEAEIFDTEDTSGLPEDLMIDSDIPAEEFDEDAPDEKKMSLAKLVHGMTIMEKVKLARFGNGEARNLLVRDRNKMVASAAIRSPKVTETEVISFAKSRSLCDDVLRIIASTPEWTKNYRVKYSLTTNPKTPIPTAIKFLNYLNDKDLKQIMRSRDVPGPISAQAKRILSRKGKI